MVEAVTATAAAAVPAAVIPANPFFGTRQIKRGSSSSMHVKEDFTPFKTGIVPEPSTVGKFIHRRGGKKARKRRERRSARARTLSTALLSLQTSS